MVGGGLSRPDEGQKVSGILFCTFPMGLFWAIFWPLVVLPMVDLNLSLLVVLKRVEWKCWPTHSRVGLAVQRAQSWSLVVAFGYYAVLTSRFSKLFQRRRSSPMIVLGWVLFPAVRRIH